MEKVLLCLWVVVLITKTANASLKMVPEKTRLLILEGDKLELQCIHQYEKQGSGDSTPRSLYFMKDNDMLNGITTKTNVTGNLWTDKFTYTKDQATILDTATYKCQLDSGSDTSINVFVFKLPVLTDVDLVEGAPLLLSCNTQTLAVPVRTNEIVVSWTRNNQSIANGDKYKLENDTLEILDPKREDMGEYQCLITLFPESNTDRHIIKPKPVAVRAPPAVDSHDNNKNLVQGDDLELKCKVSGYPTPTMQWTKDGQTVNKTKRVHLEKYEGVDSAKLTIYSLDYDDEGMYSCIAINDVEPLNATATMRLRVKDKLAALWPFLGIVAEVIILCAIILCYEKSRSKRLLDEDDGPDGNVDNPGERGNVRHRRS